MKFYTILSIFLLLCCSPAQRHAKHRFFSMDTMIDVTIVTTSDDATLAPIWATLDSFLIDWSDRYSDSGSASEIVKLNTRSNNTVAISPVLGTMLADALAWGDTTNGYFDLTILPLKELWGLGYRQQTESIPSPESIKATLQRIGYTGVHVNTTFDTVTFDQPDIIIDAGGFAKGYALIRIGSILKKNGFENFLVSAGDIVGAGRRSDGAPWLIGIRHPRRSSNAENALLATVRLDSGTIFTSGDYERRWSSNPLVHHIFNPKTGYSCTKNQSLTIWSSDPIQAKYLSTGLFGYPADSILSFINKRNLHAVIVDSMGTVHVSQRWKDKVTLLK